MSVGFTIYMAVAQSTRVGLGVLQVIIQLHNGYVQKSRSDPNLHRRSPFVLDGVERI